MSMNANNALVQVAALIVILGTGNVFAHDGHGHGEGSTHWHATDVWGFVVVGAMLAVAVWLSRGGK